MPISVRYRLFMIAADFVIIEASLWLAVWLRQVLPFGPHLTDEGWPTVPVYLIAPLVVMSANALSGLYRAEQAQTAGRELQAALRASLISTVMLAGSLYFVERQTSRWLFIYYGLLQMVLMMAVRLAARGVCRSARLPLTPPRRLAIVGTGPIGLEVAAHLHQRNPEHYRVLGFVETTRAPVNTSYPFPVLGALDGVENLVRAWKIEELVITLPLTECHALAQLMQRIQDSPVQVSVIPDYFDLAYLYARADELADIPIIRLKEPVLTAWQRATKRILDMVLASLLLVFASPVLLISALAIWLDSPGAILYRQRRLGEGSREFWMWKFRTMVCDADRHEHRLVQRQGASVQFDKRPDDPRVTRCGKILRRWSIDELPQLFNVLKGEMSLIGPRPELPALAASYSDLQRKRFAVPQGMTGWWQVNGRPQDVEQKVEHDLYYVRNCSVWLDVRILFKTIRAVLSRQGAF
jgi:exopolysaccharide biosynthesis polyprenyl glycosylphosphotransferase